MERIGCCIVPCNANRLPSSDSGRVDRFWLRFPLLSRRAIAHAGRRCRPSDPRFRLRGLTSGRRPPPEAYRDTDSFQREASAVFFSPRPALLSTSMRKLAPTAGSSRGLARLWRARHPIRLVGGPYADIGLNFPQRTGTCGMALFRERCGRSDGKVCGISGFEALRCGNNAWIFHRN